MKGIIKKAISPNPKFRIISRNNNFVPQEFIGIWKVGLYADISKGVNHSGWILYLFEHKDLAEAELVIERRKKQFKKKNFVVETHLKT